MSKEIKIPLIKPVNSYLSKKEFEIEFINTYDTKSKWDLFLSEKIKIAGKITNLEYANWYEEFLNSKLISNEEHFIIKDMYFNQAVNELSSKGWEIIDETKSNGAKHGNSLIEIQRLANKYRKAAGDDSAVGIFTGKGKVTIPLKSREEIDNLLFNFSSDFLAVIDDGFKRRNVVGWIKGKTMMNKYNRTFFIDYMCSKAKILSLSTNPDDLVALTYFKKVNEENKTVIKVYTHFSYVNPVSELGEEVSKLIRTIRQINRRSDSTISAYVLESVLQVVRKYNKKFSEYEEFLLFFLELLESKKLKENSIYDQLEEIYSDLLVPLFQEYMFNVRCVHCSS